MKPAIYVNEAGTTVVLGVETGMTRTDKPAIVIGAGLGAAVGVVAFVDVVTGAVIGIGEARIA